MFEKLDQIIHSVHLAYDLTAFDIDKCPKHHQVDNLNEARAWLRNAQTELETLGREATAHEIVVAERFRASADVWEQAQRDAARWPHATVAMGAQTSTFCDWCGLRFEPTSFDREHCTCKEPRDAE